MKTSEAEEGTIEPYKDDRAHLAEEMLRLDLMIHQRILELRKIGFDQNLDAFKGLFLSDEEVDGILQGNLQRTVPHSPTTDPDIQVCTESIEVLTRRIAQRKTVSLQQDAPLALHKLSTLFMLSPFELDCLLVCLAPELDLKYQKLFAYMQNDVTRNNPSINLVVGLLCSSFGEQTDARQYFSASAPLLRYHLLEFREERGKDHTPLLARPLRVDERIVDFILGFDQIDSRLRAFTRLISPQADFEDLTLPEDLESQIRRHFIRESCTRPGLGYLFTGPYGVGKKTTAEAICKARGKDLLIVNVDHIRAEDFSLETIVQLAFREASLRGAAIYWDNCHPLFADEKRGAYNKAIMMRGLAEFSDLAFLATEGSSESVNMVENCRFVRVDFPIPDYRLRCQLWEAGLNSRYRLAEDVEITALANKFRFSGGQINDALAAARNLALLHNGEDTPLAMDLLYQGCRAQSNRKLSLYASKISPHYTWQDIVLPENKMEQLREICSHVKHRVTVYGDWGFEGKLSLGKGLNILFSGPTGTGKTMAAEIIANELKLDLYKIDLSCVVSKYIGETEKNLSKIFKEAQTSNSILFFDEADALFGKRSEVKDSHDRYANIEIGYLLQKMEEYDGVVILATNLRRNIDEAFIRRLHFLVDFPFPDEEYRLRIWRGMFPKETPRNKDIDLEFLSKQFKIAGGNIKNVVLAAAFLAAEDSGSIGMEHLIRATHREYEKLGRLCVKTDFGKYHDLVKTWGQERI